MGRIQIWARMHFLFHIACIAILALVVFGCPHFSQQRQGKQLLESAMTWMLEGQFDSALADSRTVLETFPDGLADQAHFQIGLIYAHPENPNRNSHNAQKAFNTIVNDFPQSHLRDQAQIWISVIRNNELRKRIIGKLHEKNSALEKTVDELKEQIEDLKRVDLGFEEKKQKAIDQQLEKDQ